eukprot:9711391-Lingulodinium_polyedra.AAC.1
MWPTTGQQNPTTLEQTDADANILCCLRCCAAARARGPGAIRVPKTNPGGVHKHALLGENANEAL